MPEALHPSDALANSEPQGQSDTPEAMVDSETEIVAAEVPAAVEYPADEVLLAAVVLARTALLEITPAESIGEPIGHKVEGDRVMSLYFACTLTGYPGWRWTVSLARSDENAQPSVLETELTPGDGALLAPEWVPWSERLADYSAAQDAITTEAAEAALAALEGIDDIDDDDDDSDDDSDDDHGVDDDAFETDDDDESDDEYEDDDYDESDDDDADDDDADDNDADDNDADEEEEDDDDEEGNDEEGDGISDDDARSVSVSRAATAPRRARVRRAQGR